MISLTLGVLLCTKWLLSDVPFGKTSANFLMRKENFLIDQNLVSELSENLHVLI